MRGLQCLAPCWALRWQHPSRIYSRAWQHSCCLGLPCHGARLPLLLPPPPRAIKEEGAAGTPAWPRHWLQLPRPKPTAQWMMMLMAGPQDSSAALGAMAARPWAGRPIWATLLPMPGLSMLLLLALVAAPLMPLLPPLRLLLAVAFHPASSMHLTNRLESMHRHTLSMVACR